MIHFRLGGHIRPHHQICVLLGEPFFLALPNNVGHMAHNFSSSDASWVVLSRGEDMLCMPFMGFGRGKDSRIL